MAVAQAENDMKMAADEAANEVEAAPPQLKPKLVTFPPLLSPLHLLSMPETAHPSKALSPSRQLLWTKICPLRLQGPRGCVTRRSLCSSRAALSMLSSCPNSLAREG